MAVNIGYGMINGIPQMNSVKALPLGVESF